jgi:sugar phosphate isomerase/epimerase
MSALPFPLGYKLQLGWREQRRRGELPPVQSGAPPDRDDAQALYRCLRDAGFAHVEFSVGSCRSPAERDRLSRETAACREAGLGVCLHPYLGEDENPAAFGRREASGEAIRSVVEACRGVGALTGRPVGLVVHPAELRHSGRRDGLAELRAELRRRSREFLGELARRAAACGQDVRPFAEHQVPPSPEEPVIRVGDTYEELLRAVEGLGLDLCWDTGHYMLSVARHGQAERPPAEFVRRVGYVHLHDVVAGADHRLISPGSARLRDYVAMLMGAGFSGGVTLEYSAEAMREAGSFEAVVGRSLESLAAWLA